MPEAKRYQDIPCTVIESADKILSKLSISQDINLNEWYYLLNKNEHLEKTNIEEFAVF